MSGPADPVGDKGAVGEGPTAVSGPSGRGPLRRLRDAADTVNRRVPECTTGRLWAIAGASTLVGALAGAHPSGVPWADPLWSAGFGALVVLASSRARRWALVWLGGLATIVGVGGDALGLLAALVLAVLVVVVAVVSDRRHRLVAALVGAFAAQALLRGPSYGVIGLPTVVGALAVVPVLWSGYRMASRRERRISARVALGAVGLLALAALGTLAAVAPGVGALRTGQRSATAGLDLIRGGESEPAATDFDRASRDFRRAEDAFDNPLAWAGSVVPVVGQQLAGLRHVASAGSMLSTAALQTASTADYRSVTPTDGVVDIDRLVGLQQPVDDASVAVAAALDEVRAADSPWLVAPFADELDRVERKIVDVGDQTELASHALAVAPDMLGAERPMVYLLAFATPAESRNGGGFIGAYGLLQADHGRLELLATGDLSELNPGRDPGDAYAFDPPPDWEERYGSYFVQRFLGNLGASPDWPTDAGVAAQLFPQTPGGTRLDGVIYADPTALAALLGLVGPIDVPGIDQRLNADNVERFLLVDQYKEFAGNNSQRKELLGDVARSTFDALTSRPLPGIGRLTKVLGPTVAGGHLRVAAFDPAAEAFLDDAGLSGRWIAPPGHDVLSVRSANTLPNKIDAFLHRDISVETTVDPATGQLTEVLTAVLRNDAPADGLPSVRHRQQHRSAGRHQPPPAHGRHGSHARGGDARRCAGGGREPDRVRDAGLFDRGRAASRIDAGPSLAPHRCRTRSALSPRCPEPAHGEPRPVHHRGSRGPWSRSVAAVLRPSRPHRLRGWLKPPSLPADQRMVAHDTVVNYRDAHHICSRPTITKGGPRAIISSDCCRAGARFHGGSHLRGARRCPGVHGSDRRRASAGRGAQRGRCPVHGLPG